MKTQKHFFAREILLVFIMKQICATHVPGCCHDKGRLRDYCASFFEFQNFMQSQCLLDNIELSETENVFPFCRKIA